MKVLFDHQIFQLQKAGGISKSYCEIFKRFQSSLSIEISVKRSDNIYLQDLSNFSGIMIHQKPHSGDFSCIHSFIEAHPRIIKSINTLSSIHLLTKKDYDVFQPTYFDPYFLPFLGTKPFVLTIHDLIPELYPQFFSDNDPQMVGRKKLIEKANAIVAVSNNTKNDIISYYGIPSNKINVIYHGGPEPHIIDVYRHSSSSPVILFVGSRGGYKNFMKLLPAFKKILLDYPYAVLECIGGGDFTPEEINMIAHYGLENSIKKVSATEQELEMHYSKASMLVYPTEYEGFGMPILEAFAYGCPVITSTGGSLTEVGGKAALYFSGNEEDLYNKMCYVLNLSNQELSEIKKRGLEQLNHFSWENSAKSYTELYRSLIS